VRCRELAANQGKEIVSRSFPAKRTMNIIG
jgi:hypothetical protein